VPLDLFPSLVGIDCLVNQAWELRFSRVPGLACNRKLSLEKGDLLSHLASLPMNRSQEGDTFLGHPPSLGSLGLYHDGGRPRLGRLLPKLGRVCSVLG
jgi:hypothetical protein